MSTDQEYCSDQREAQLLWQQNNLRDEYGDKSLLCGLKKSLEKKVIGADYVCNILYQEMTPATTHQPVKLKKEELNDITLTTPALEEYDAIILKRRKNNE
ncbi:hypothetical protein [Desulfogranum marinum]|uniref:hypothetical protein n=1 Tax=Desulfogranum marinum TaxID=453220 RepID=UPI0029C8848F|nr:hypothetical protein [Desulfogranum marinum]